ncbi:hypothetical protein PUN4_160111 [Paraburkholderia unamae]|nr:hypothetical protein PUN4_160111 [Paraburkholderia unamae]
MTALLTWRAIALKPSCSKRRPRSAGLGAANSTNSSPAMPNGLSACGGRLEGLDMQWAPDASAETDTKQASPRFARSTPILTSSYTFHEGLRRASGRAISVQTRKTFDYRTHMRDNRAKRRPHALPDSAPRPMLRFTVGARAQAWHRRT